MVISRAILVNCWPFLASVRAFLCLIEDHLECPDIVSPSESLSHLQPDDSMKSTLQHHAVDRDELVIGRTYRLAIDPEALLPNEPPRLVLAGHQPGVEKQLGDRPLGRPDVDGCGTGRLEAPRVLAILAGLRVGVELPDNPLR